MLGHQARRTERCGECDDYGHRTRAAGLESRQTRKKDQILNPKSYCRKVPCGQVVATCVSPTRHQNNSAGNKNRHCRPFRHFASKQAASSSACSRAWPPPLAAPMVIRVVSWHWPSSSRVQRDVLPLSSREKSCASPSHSIYPNHCFASCIQAFEFRCRPSLHYGDNLHLLLAETTVWRSQPSAYCYSILLLCTSSSSDGQALTNGP